MRLDRDPVRDPRSGSASERTRRAGILLLLTLLVPGGAQVVAGSRRLGRAALRVTFAVWVLVAVAAVLFVVARGTLLNLVTNPVVLTVLIAVLVVLALGWAFLWFDTFRLVRLHLLAPGAKKATVIATVLALVVSSGGLAYTAWLANSGRSAVSTIFGSGPAVEEVDGRYNFLVMGGDAGEGRAGLRPDSIHVASVDADTGSTVLFSIPRNFQNAQFSEDSPLWRAYPNGFDCGDECIINALYMDVMKNHQDLYPEAEDPGAEAMMDAAGGILGLEVTGYVLVDMDGFSKLIDSMGGVTITTGGWVTHRGQRPDGQWGNVWWEPGTHTFDGDDALAFARSRKFASDYSRIRRQQCMQQAMLDQFTPATVLTKFEGIMAAGEQIVETNLPQSQLGTFVDLAERSRGQQMERLTIGAPDFGTQAEKFSTYPDFDRIHTRVDELLAEDAAQAAGTGASPLPLLTVVAQDEEPIAEQDGVQEDDPDTWPAPPTEYQGQPITDELLMQLEDAGNEAALSEIAATNELCSSGG